LCEKIITYVKDEGVNLNTFKSAWTNIVSCVPLLLAKPYVASCYGHAMSNCCEYTINDWKVCAKVREVSIRDAY